MAPVADLVAAVNREIINPILALLFALALMYFLWGGFIFIISQGDETKRLEGRNHMLWGLIGMLIMVSVFALLNIGLATFGVNKNDPRQFPTALPTF